MKLVVATLVTGVLALAGVLVSNSLGRAVVVDIVMAVLSPVMAELDAAPPSDGSSDG